jgi:hypothetical protein
VSIADGFHLKPLGRRRSQDLDFAHPICLMLFRVHSPGFFDTRRTGVQ